MKILIAEDDPVSRCILEELLAKWGYEVVVACDGHEAIARLAAAEPPQVAILDWMMPGMDGVEVCRAARRRVAQPYTYILQHGPEGVVA